MDLRRSPQYKSRLIARSIIESNIPGLPPFAFLGGVNFVSDFRHAEIIADVRACDLSPNPVLHHYRRRFIVSAHEKESRSWSKLELARRIQSRKQVLVIQPHCGHSHPRRGLHRPFQNEIGALHHIRGLRYSGAICQGEQSDDQCKRDEPLHAIILTISLDAPFPARSREPTAHDQSRHPRKLITYTLRLYR